MWYLVLIIIFINVVFYYSSKRDAKYKEGMLFLVTIPEYAIESMEVQKIITFYNKYLNLSLIGTFIISALLILLSNLFPSLIITFILLIMIFVNAIILQIPFKKARDKLLQVKKENNWLVMNEKSYKVDLQLSSYMEQQSFKLKRFYNVILIDIFAIIFMVKYNADIMMYPFMILQIIVLFGGLLFIKKQGNQAFCENSEANITINLKRKQTFYDCFFYLTLCDALFNLVIQLYLLEKLKFIYIIFTITLSFIAIILTLYKVKDYYNKKAEILSFFNESNYSLSDDDCWKIGLMGPVYHNPYDPRTLVSMPGGTQLTFNTAKNGYRYFIIGVISIIFCFLVWLFGYPYYLDITHNLVDLSLKNNKIEITSEFYNFNIDIDTIEKLEITNSLGEGKRTNGTDTGIYSKGNYRYDKYGDCKVYLANLHECYIIIYTKDNIYIINDDDTGDTKSFYQQLKGVIKNDN
ncbi:MAG: PH domain-containing protein [Thomasclavelia sp.]|uniref:PH domain-containing protein n=1 Tax=Thomasclavelia sp. TaxID=3025757 RepID=UPI0039A0AF6E